MTTKMLSGSLIKISKLIVRKSYLRVLETRTIKLFIFDTF